MAIFPIACVPLPLSDGLCISMPGGAEICATWPFPSPPSADALMRMFMAQLQTALAPLAPLFTALDIIAIIIDIITALATLNPKKIFEAMKKLPEAIVALLAIIPQVSIPLMLIGFLDTMIFFMVGYSEYLEKTSAQIALLADAATYQDTLGAGALAAAILCGESSLDQFMFAASEGLGPVNSLITSINALLGLIGLGKFQIPTLAEVTTANIDITLTILRETTEFLLIIRNAIPI